MMTASTATSHHCNNEQHPEVANPRPITVLEDAKNFNIKHPLQYTWKLWYKDKVAESNPTSGTSDWQNALKSVDDIGTVEDFWGWFNVMPKPSDVKLGGDIFLFQQGIEPSWEDAAHLNGSSLAWTLPRSGTSFSLPTNAATSEVSGSENSSMGGTPSNREYLDYWLNAMLACIGCSMPTAYQQVTGVQFAARDRGSRITLWLRTSDPEIVRQVEAEFRSALQEGLTNTPSEIHFKWEEFSSQLAKQSQHPGYHRRSTQGSSGGYHSTHRNSRSNSNSHNNNSNSTRYYSNKRE